MCPPKACPMANSRPHIEHSCDLGFVGTKLVPFVESPSVLSRGYLWLDRWPPSAWKDGYWRLHVFHSNTRLGELSYDDSLLVDPLKSNIKQLAMLDIAVSSSYVYFVVQLLNTK